MRNTYLGYDLNNAMYGMYNETNNLCTRGGDKV